MSFTVLGHTRDIRSGAYVVYCKCNIDTYLSIAGEDFASFSIQRRKESHKAYQRLRSDLKEGALLPSITLAVKHHRVSSIKSILDDTDKLGNALSSTDIVDILDGLQRTYLMKELQEEGHNFDDSHELLLEYWVEENISKLIYRMIVLNAGQKAMSMRHQIELLFMSLKETVSQKISGVEIFTERDSQRRTQPNKYSLGVVASAYQAYMTKSTELDKENIVAQELSKNNILDSSEAELTNRFNEFIEIFKVIKEVDRLAWSKYTDTFDDAEYKALKDVENRSDDQEVKFQELDALKQAHSWLGTDNVFISLFCAISIYYSNDKRDRVNKALNKLMERINLEDDPFGIKTYSRIKTGINPRKVNVGYATRKILLNGFKEYFRDDGDISMDECWKQASD